MVPIVNSVNIGDYLSNPNRLLKKWAIIFLHSWSQILLNNVQRIISHLMACKIWKKNAKKNIIACLFDFRENQYYYARQTTYALSSTFPGNFFLTTAEE